MKRGLILIIFLIMITPVLADSNEITTTTIPAQSLNTGENKQVLDLDNYFNGTNLVYKFKAGAKGLSGINVTFDGSFVDINANNPGSYSVIFIGDNDTDDKESNDVNLNIAGEIILPPEPLDFVPVGSSITMKVGEKKTFAVSGENVSAEWYLNDLKLPETSGTFIYDAALAGTNSLEVRVGAETNTWTVVIETIIVEETNQTPPTVVNSAVCGNNKREGGENCQSCPQDVQCTGGSSCINAICVKDQGVGGPAIWIGVLGFVIIVIVGGVIFAKQKGVFDNLSFDFISNLFNKFKKKKEEVKETKEEPQEDLSVLRGYLESNLKAGHSKEELSKAALGQGWEQEQIDKVLDTKETSTGHKEVVKKDLGPLQNYIEGNLKKGYNREQLVKAVLGQGWEQSDVDEVLAKLRK